MSEDQNLQSLYRQTVLDHCRHPRNFRRMERADRRAEGHNPLCGDKVTMYVRLDGDTIADVAFEATGCAISLASASMLTERVRGRRLADAEAAIAEVAAVFSTGRAAPAAALHGDLAALGGVRAYPSRVKCATLAWQTLQAALRGAPGTATTE
jgi:nitrogen fixation NifU-like protein